MNKNTLNRGCTFHLAQLLGPEAVFGVNFWGGAPQGPQNMKGPNIFFLKYLYPFRKIVCTLLGIKWAKQILQSNLLSIWLIGEKNNCVSSPIGADLMTTCKFLIRDKINSRAGDGNLRIC